MGFYLWRRRISLATREAAGVRPVTKADHDSLIARWREAMAFERSVKWPSYHEPILLQVPAGRPRD